MTKEELLKAFTADPTFSIKTDLTEEQISRIRFSEKSNSKLVETIKLAIDGVISDDSENIIVRKIHGSLNK